MKSVGHPENELIKDILSGSVDKYSTLIDEYAPMVFHVVRRFINDDDEVEEMAQQIFVKAYERLEKFDMKSKFSTWLYALSMNHCRDYAKNVRRDNKVFSQMDQEELRSKLSSDTSPADDLESKEMNRMLEEALTRITPDFAEAFLMKYREDISYNEMSERLNVTVSALKVRVHRARKELRAYLQSKM